MLSPPNLSAVLGIAAMRVAGNSSTDIMVTRIVDLDGDHLCLYEYERVDLLANIDGKAVQ